LFKQLDLTFITNEPGQTLLQRFEQLIRDSRYFDCLVAYFYLSGFHALYRSLEQAEKIRVLVGIRVSQDTYDLVSEGGNLNFSHYKTKEKVEKDVVSELAESEDAHEIEEGIQKFMEWVRCGKLEIRAYPSQNIHAKVYIMTFKEGDRDVGRVITGSSNFTQSGLVDNLEFNVELKNRADYEFALAKFNELWENAVDVSEGYVQTIQNKTWMNDTITPYELYLKFLYEYFMDELSRTDELSERYLPEHFKRFEYQRQAVINAKRILEEYGGVFLSDVVGLGKTYMAVMLVSQLDGRTMVIAPPSLLNPNNPGSWRNVFADFNIHAEYVSIGKLKEAKRLVESREYLNIIIDESHRFRSESTIGYEDIMEICRGKRVILISATPYNNSPKDILSQIKLFQNTRKSTIPGMEDLETFFNILEKKQSTIDRRKNYNEYIKQVQENAKEIRNRVLKYIMVRRTRREIEKYFSEDLSRNNIKFPEVTDPKPFYYKLNEDEDRIFMETVELLAQKFKYARYMPLLYLKEKIKPLEEQSQKNLGGFMKVLIVKRLESSFYAFRKSVDRFIYSYEMFLKGYNKGEIYISKEYANKIFELLEEGDDEKIQQLIDEGKAEKYERDDFRLELQDDLEHDLDMLKEIKSKWDRITRDPKIETLIHDLKHNDILKNGKIVLFTESKETAEYLVGRINSQIGKEEALLFHGQSPEIIKDKVIENFDARVRHPKDDYRILITTDVLAEGVNLHRSNIVINYDIPWNPTKLMQRVGRVNRIDTRFDTIYTYNFFPTKQADSEIELTHIARSKIESFLNLLGGDAAILTEGEPVESHELFDRLISRNTIIDDEGEESELKYLRVIEDIRDKAPDLFERIKHLPKKARSSKRGLDFIANMSFPILLTFHKKGKLMKFFLANKEQVSELDFLSSAKIFECISDEPRVKIDVSHYYELLEKNKLAFLNATIEGNIPEVRRSGTSNVARLLKILKIIRSNKKQLTEEQEKYLIKLIDKLEEDSIPARTVKKVVNALDKLKHEIQNPLKVLAVLQKNISPALLKSHYVDAFATPNERREVILSLYMT